MGHARLVRGSHGVARLALALCLAGGLGAAEGPVGAVPSGLVSSRQPTLEVGDLLVARRALPDPNFRDTVVLLLAYGSQEGAAGVIVNRPGEQSVEEVVEESSPLARRDDTLYFGGPVAPSAMLVLLRGERAPAGMGTAVLPDVFLLDGMEALEALVSSRVPPSEVRFYAGYAGWSAGQLESEIARGDWHLARGDASRIFSSQPDATWGSLIRFLLGPRA